MALNKPRTSFGFASMTAVSRTTGLTLGMIKVAQSYDPTSEREQIDLYGGSNPNAWDSADGNISNDIAITLSEFKPLMYELAGYTVTKSEAAEVSGNVTVGANNIGATVIAATGVASVALSTAAGAASNLKEGRYLMTSTSATAVQIYAVSDNDFERGDDLTYVDDTLRITTSALTITQGAVTVIPNIGVALTGGTGTIAMTPGDVAYFDVRKPNEGYYEYSYGENPVPIEFDMWLVSQKKSNGEYVLDRYPRVKFNSIPGGMTAKEWTNVDVAVKVLYDSTLGFAMKRYDTVQDLT